MLRLNQSLECLILTNVEIGATGAMSLGEALKENTSLQRLHMGHRISINAHREDDRTYPFQIGNHGMSSLFRYSLNLREVDLSCNGIGDSGILPLIEHLHSNERFRNTLVSLNLNNNRINGEAALNLLDAFSVPTIRKFISLKRNRLVNEDRALLRSKEKADALNMHIFVDPPVILRPKLKKRAEFKLGAVTAEKRNVFLLAGK